MAANVSGDIAKFIGNPKLTKNGQFSHKSTYFERSTKSQTLKFGQVASVTWDFWKFWFFAILWAREVQIFIIFVNFGISQAYKMAKNQNFQKSQITFGKYHKWSNLAKFQGLGPCRSLKLSLFRWKLWFLWKIRKILKFELCGLIKWQKIKISKNPK